SAELESRVVGATHTEVARRLTAQRDSLVTERRQRERLGEQQMVSLSRRLAVLKAEEMQLGREIATQRRRLALAAKSESRQRVLRQENFVSDEQVQTVEENRLDQESKLSTLERLEISTQRDRLGLEGELLELPLKSQTEIASIERNIASVEQELAQAEA